MIFHMVWIVIRLFPVKTHFLTPKADMLVIGAILDQVRGFFWVNTLSKMDRSMWKSRKMWQKTAATYTLLAPLHLKVRQVVVRFNQRRWLSVAKINRSRQATFLVRRILSIELKCSYISKMSFERGCRWQQHRFVPGTVPWKLRPFVPWKLRPFIPCLLKTF